MRSSLVLSTALLGLSILPAMAAATHGVSWYISHPQELHETIATCQDDPGDLASTPDCVNAMDAQRELAISAL